MPAGLTCGIAQETRSFFTLIRQSIVQAKLIKPRIIVAHGYKENIVGFVLCLCTGAKLVTTFHGLTENYRGFKRTKMAGYLFLSRLIWRFYSTRVVTVSNRLAHDLGISDLPKLRVVWNVIDCEGRSNKTDEVFVQRPALLLLGRLVRVKRCDLAIRAVKELVNSGIDACLYVAGEGGLKNELMTLVKDLKLEDNVRFLGFRNDVKELIAACDIFLITSDSEGIPTVLLEALYACRPVVATRVGGIDEVTQVFNGYPIRLVDPSDYLAISDALIDFIKKVPVISDHEKVRKLFKEYFSPEPAASKHEQMYIEIMKSN